MTVALHPPFASAGQAASRPTWQAAFSQVRQHTLRLTAGLSAEDLALQSMPDASPGKWHLAHTSWFFETLVLQAHQAGYQLVDGRWPALFNSYYESLGPRHPRPQRGLLSRPSLDAVLHYRQQVDAAVLHFIHTASATTWAAAAGTLRLGLHHEQQHQELLLTDILHAFSRNPLRPAYRPTDAALPAGLAGVAASLPTLAPAPAPAGGGWLRLNPGPVPIGQPPEAAGSERTQAGDGTDSSHFAFDNERPRHTVWLAPFELACNLVSCADFAAFIADGGYRQPALWLSDGWAQVQAQGWQAPANWLPLASDGSHRGGFEQFTLHGVQPLDLAAPVCHLSGYEAAAFAAWAGARLPTEFEWEHAAVSQAGHPGPLHQLLGAVWQWTSSAYAPYPGFRPLPGPAAEYNGKFMVNQLVLRGSSFATPPGHARLSYRNFFPPGARWQFSGLRLARDGVA